VTTTRKRLRYCRRSVKQQLSRKTDNKHDVPRYLYNMDTKIIKKPTKEGKIKRFERKL